MKQYKRFGDTLHETFTPPPPVASPAIPKKETREIPGYTPTDAIEMYDVPPNIQQQEYQRENTAFNPQKAIREFQRKMPMPPNGSSLYGYDAGNASMPPQPHSQQQLVYPLPPQQVQPSYPPPQMYSVPQGQYYVPQPDPTYTLYAQPPFMSQTRLAKAKQSVYMEDEMEEDEVDMPRMKRKLRRSKNVPCSYLKTHLRTCKYCKYRLNQGSDFMYKVIIGFLSLIILYLMFNKSR